MWAEREYEGFIRGESALRKWHASKHLSTVRPCLWKRRCFGERDSVEAAIRGDSFIQKWVSICIQTSEPDRARPF